MILPFIVALWLQLVNTDRVAAGAPPLTPTPALRALAQWRAGSLAATQTFTHDYVLPVQWRPFMPADRGENLGWCTCDATTIERALLDSPAHRANLLNPVYHHVGLGMAQAADGTSYYAQIFAD